MADLTRSKRVIQSLTDSGILVSIDDFGTGFSSLSHLNDLAVGELKLDRTFTSRLQSVTQTRGTRTSSARSSTSVTPSGCGSSPKVSSGSASSGFWLRSGATRAGLRHSGPMSSRKDRFRRVEGIAGCRWSRAQ